MFPFCRTVTLFTDSTSIPDALSYFFMAVAVYMAFGRSIFDFHVPHNAVCFPHKILHKNSFQTLVGVAIVFLREWTQNFCRENKLNYGVHESRKFRFQRQASLYRLIPYSTHNPVSQHCLKGISMFIVFVQLISSTLQHQSRRKINF